MGEVISSETRRARKPYVCSYCRSLIRVGQSHLRWAYADGGSVHASRGHSECVQMHSSLANPWDEDELMDPDEFREECEAELDGPFPWNQPESRA